jgi:hypothetical protein
MLSLFLVGIGSIAARARVLIHEVSRAEEAAGLRRAHSADCPGLEVEAPIAPGKTWYPSRAKKQPGGGQHAGEKRRGGAQIRKKLFVAVWAGYKKFRWYLRVIPNGEMERF